ncbi:hypothetical protein ACFL1C_08210, partial [Pseudomonadota bacterium]
GQQEMTGPGIVHSRFSIGVWKQMQVYSPRAAMKTYDVNYQAFLAHSSAARIQLAAWRGPGWFGDGTQVFHDRFVAQF